MAEAIERQAANYILRQEEASWTEDDERKLQAWLQLSMRHSAIYWRLQHGWEAAERVASLNLPPLHTWNVASRIKSMVLKTGFAAAAALVPLAFALPTFFSSTPEPQFSSFETDIGQRRRLSLPDGSEIELNTGTKLRVKLTERSRIVLLDRGEAFFSVSHNPARPFLVRSGTRLLRVLGTKFAVRVDDERTVASVVDGRVRFGQIVGGQLKETFILKRGDFAVATRNQTLATYGDMNAVSNMLGWRHGTLIFDGVSLAEAAREFNRYNKRKLQIEGDPTASIEIGGSFAARNIDGFARLMKTAYGLRIQEAEGTIKISHY